VGKQSGYEEIASPRQGGVRNDGLVFRGVLNINNFCLEKLILLLKKVTLMG
jgi:hypothetical protein